MPPPLVYSGFEKLAEDKSLTDRMRTKYRTVLVDLAYRLRHGYIEHQRRASTGSDFDR
jgi:hypothetical protein